MTLALLITAATGAWAQTETLLTTIESTANKTFTSGSKTFDNIATVTFSQLVNNDGDGWGWFRGNETTITVTAANNDVTITKVKFYCSEGSAFDEEAPFEAIVKFEVSDNITKVNGTSIGRYGVNKIEVYGYVTPAAPGVEVTTNAASEGATFTEATFNMPAYDATADYELVRDMSIQMTAQVGDGTQEQPRYRVKKDGNNKFIPADMEITAVPALFTVNDAIEQKALTQTQDYIVQIYAIEAEGQPTGEAMTFATFTFEPGIYAVKAVAAQGSDYDGETALSNTFKLFQGYEVTVGAGEYATFYKDENLYTEDEDAELYTISSVSDTEAVLSSEINVVAAGTPMLIFNKGTEAKTFILIPTEQSADEVEVAKEFRGTLEEKQMPASSATRDFYVCTGKAFEWVRDAGTIAANRCWLQIGEQVAAARAMTRSIVGGGNTTNMDDVRWQMEDGNYYDLQGRKVEKPNRKGIYIHNGKKVIVR